MNRRQFLAGSVGMAIAAPVLAQLPNKVAPSYAREVVFHTPFDRVTGGGMAAGELCYFQGNKKRRSDDVFDLYLFSARFNRANELVSKHDKMLFVLEVDPGLWWNKDRSFDSVAEIRNYALENDLFALVDGTFALPYLDTMYLNCSADFIIVHNELKYSGDRNESIALVKNRIGERMIVNFDPLTKKYS